MTRYQGAQIWSVRRRPNEEEGPEETLAGEKKKRLSPQQRCRRQSLARNKKKQWGEESITLLCGRRLADMHKILNPSGSAKLELRTFCVHVTILKILIDTYAQV